MKNEPSGNSGELYEENVHLKIIDPGETKWIQVEIPIRTVSEANSSEHWTKKHRRKQAQRFALEFGLAWYKKEIRLPCHITLTRIAPRSLDTGDNLPCSFKHIRDVIAELITGDKRPGLADSDERLTWEYKQEKGKPKQYAIRITFKFA